MKQMVIVLACLIAGSAGLAAGQGMAGGQPQPQLPTSTSAEVSSIYNNVASYITRTATMVPAEKYAWQPTPDVCSFAGLFAHITDDNNGACAAMAGVTPAPARMDTGSAGAWAADTMSKADLEKALNASVELCKKAFAAVDQSNMMESAGGRGTRTKIGQLIYNTSHINEHYGNLVTYLRLNGMVPPSSGGK